MFKKIKPYFFIALTLVFLFTLGSQAIYAEAGDFHFHLASSEMVKLLQEIAGASYPVDSLQEISGMTAISRLDQAGLERGFLLSFAYLLGKPEVEAPLEYADVKKENNYLALEVARYPDRLHGFFSVNPLSPYALVEISRCVKLLNLPGLKLHFTSGDVNLRNDVQLDQVKKVFRQAAEMGIPVILHFRNRSEDFGRVDVEIFISEILEAIPDLKIQIAHLGGWGGFDRATEEVFRAFIDGFEKNPELDKSRVFMDISGVIITDEMVVENGLQPTSLLERWKVAEMLREWGLDQVVFGSDWPLVSPDDYIRIIREKLPLTQWEINTIMENDPTERLLGEEIRTPSLNTLKLFLQEGIDYNAPMSVDY